MGCLWFGIFIINVEGENMIDLEENSKKLENLENRLINIGGSLWHI